MTATKYIIKDSNSVWNFGNLEIVDGALTPTDGETLTPDTFRLYYKTVGYSFVQVGLKFKTIDAFIFGPYDLSTIAQDITGTPYPSLEVFRKVTSELFKPSATAEGQELLLGKLDCVNPVGTAKFSAPEGYYFYACRSRVDGTTIASLEKNLNGNVLDDTTDSYIDVVTNQGETHFFANKIVSVTLTNATDQLQLYLAKL